MLLVSYSVYNYSVVLNLIYLFIYLSTEEHFVDLCLLTVIRLTKLIQQALPPKS
jgi:hypothetical protein